MVPAPTAGLHLAAPGGAATVRRGGALGTTVPLPLVCLLNTGPATGQAGGSGAVGAAASIDRYVEGVLDPERYAVLAHALVAGAGGGLLGRAAAPVGGAPGRWLPAPAPRGCRRRDWTDRRRPDPATSGQRADRRREPAPVAQGGVRPGRGAHLPRRRSTRSVVTSPARISSRALGLVHVRLRQQPVVVPGVAEGVRLGEPAGRQPAVGHQPGRAGSHRARRPGGTGSPRSPHRPTTVPSVVHQVAVAAPVQHRGDQVEVSGASSRSASPTPASASESSVPGSSTSPGRRRRAAGPACRERPLGQPGGHPAGLVPGAVAGVEAAGQLGGHRRAAARRARRRRARRPAGSPYAGRRHRPAAQPGLGGQPRRPAPRRRRTPSRRGRRSAGPAGAAARRGWPARVRVPGQRAEPQVRGEVRERRRAPAGAAGTPAGAPPRPRSDSPVPQVRAAAPATSARSGWSGQAAGSPARLGASSAERRASHSPQPASSSARGGPGRSRGSRRRVGRVCRPTASYQCRAVGSSPRWSAIRQRSSATVGASGPSAPTRRRQVVAAGRRVWSSPTRGVPSSASTAYRW